MKEELLNIIIYINKLKFDINYDKILITAAFLSTNPGALTLCIQILDNSTPYLGKSLLIDRGLFDPVYITELLIDNINSLLTHEDFIPYKDSCKGIFISTLNV